MIFVTGCVNKRARFFWKVSLLLFSLKRLVLFQICAGLKEMHTHDPPYAHNDMKPGNVLLTLRPNQPPIAIVMDFGSATLAHKQVRSRAEALVVQVHPIRTFPCLL